MLAIAILIKYHSGRCLKGAAFLLITACIRETDYALC